MEATSERWDEFVYWARKMITHPDWDKTERNYKIAIAQTVEKARESFLAGDDSWKAHLKRAFSSPAGPVNWRVFSAFWKWYDSETELADQALRSVWTRGLEGMEQFLALLPKSAISGSSGRLALTSFLLGGVNINDYPWYRSTPFQNAYKLLHLPGPPDYADDMQVYRDALDLTDRIVEESRERGLSLRDRLDAQGIIWFMAGDGWFTIDDPERPAFLAFKGQKMPARPQPSEPVEKAESLAAPGSGETVLGPWTLEELADKLLLDVEYLRNVQRLLEDKRQVIFYGPPGTGKTYVARELATLFAARPDQAEANGAVTLVQFHPSYAYEDFVQGYRPVAGGGFALRDGPLKRAADVARADGSGIHVLVIDEINRGNIAKVFGELYFLLEYRNHELRLQYSDEPFTLPENLWIIGMICSQYHHRMEYSCESHIVAHGWHGRHAR
jgi:5-methylcytosine-specific restriction enzyme B